MISDPKGSGEALYAAGIDLLNENKAKDALVAFSLAESAGNEKAREVMEAVRKKASRIPGVENAAALEDAW